MLHSNNIFAGSDCCSRCIRSGSDTPRSALTGCLPNQRKPGSATQERPQRRALRPGSNLGLVGSRYGLSSPSGADEPGPGAGASGDAQLGAGVGAASGTAAIGAAGLGARGLRGGLGAGVGAAATGAAFFAAAFLAPAFLADFFGAAALDFLADFFAFLADFFAFFTDFLAAFFEDFFADFFLALTSFLFFFSFLPFLLFFPLAIVNLLLPPIIVYQAFQVVRFRTGPIDSDQSWPGTACRPIEKLNRMHHRN